MPSLLRVCSRKNILARFCHQPPKASRGQVCTTPRFAAPPLEETVAYSPRKAQNRQKCTRRDELGLILSRRMARVLQNPEETTLSILSEVCETRGRRMDQPHTTGARRRALPNLPPLLIFCEGRQDSRLSPGRRFRHAGARSYSLDAVATITSGKARPAQSGR